ncbi:FemAB family XrtA/PEP-CTERM system-associated protein [Acidihalobacter ferrooxydans]|uniref:Peptidoglycan bridge formation protein FemAB n=1 Tax=Acidihalobacter ferrooxydans TaxID=1765967 RepID=A0A1P8UIA4_9GAMM|nr:FemAB family XrtA/PEP-CTERM system-associated protein [Acidihalobacter ferrooxydans]APZ43491.1 peptidoglycan bridge formation protein FemAB [Acidihalobacter ferrooxydans]
MSVRLMTAADAPAWDDFVGQHPEATFFHRAGWKDVLERAFGHRGYYLLAEQGGAVTGVLPLARIRSRLFQDALISTPFCVYGGPVAVDEATCEALIDAASAQARELEVDYLELRQLRPTRPDWPEKSLYVTFRRELSQDHEVNLKAVPRKQRAVIRKSLKAGMQAAPDNDLDAFYRVYSESLRNLGTPVFSRHYVRMLLEIFPDAAEILTVRHQRQPVSAVLSFYFRDEVLPYYGGGALAARDLKAYDLMYWDLMCRAVDRGVRVFDFGRSKLDTGSYSYKVHWGFEPQPLHYAYDLVRQREMPDLSPKNPKYERFIRLWQRLPLPLSRLLGPPLARSLG